MATRKPFAVDEWYHCYTRGIERSHTFRGAADYARFVENLYLLNSDIVMHRSDLHLLTHEEILAKERGEQLVSIGAYCLMPNHFHLVLREKQEGGIARFMQRLGTAYTMYFNLRHERIGSLFVKPFRSRHIDDDAYLQRVVQYVHLNPAELFDEGFKDGNVRSVSALKKRVRAYPYSSLPDFTGVERPESNILDGGTRDLFSEQMPFSDLLADAVEYYRDIGVST
jgi:putative transposase